MKKEELKKMLKPLVREVIKEVLLEESGVLSNVIKEVVAAQGPVINTRQRMPIAEGQLDDSYFEEAPAQGRRVSSNPHEAILHQANATEGLFEGEETLQHDEMQQNLQQEAIERQKRLIHKIGLGEGVFEGTKALGSGGEVNEVGTGGHGALDGLDPDDEGMDLTAIQQLSRGHWGTILETLDNRR